MAVKRALMQDDVAMQNVFLGQAGASLTGATIAAAIASAAGVPRRLFLTPGTWNITSNLVIPSNIVLALPPGTLLNPSSGITITFEGSLLLDTPYKQIFTTAGNVLFTAPWQEPVFPHWWGAIADGVTNDLVAINKAFAASRHVHFPAGTYWLGTAAPGVRLIDLSSFGSGITITTAGVVLLRCQTSPATGVPVFFFLQNNPNFFCDQIHFDDLGSNFDTFAPGVGTAIIGAMAFYVENTAAAYNWHGMNFEGIHCTNMVGGLIVAQTPPYSYVNRISGIHIKKMTFINGYYGINFQNEGDGLTVNSMYTERTIRAYFVYGCRGHDVQNLFSWYSRASSAHVNISRQPGGLDTSDIRVNLTSRGDLTDSCTNHVDINHGDLSGGVIRGVHVHVDIIPSDSHAYTPVKFTNYGPSGESTAPSSNFVSDIFLSGSCTGGTPLPVSVTATYAALGRSHFQSGLNFFANQTFRNSFQLNEQAHGVPCGWRTSDVQPIIGNGSLKYSIDLIEGVAFITVNLLIGSTTNVGSGQWFFTGFLDNFATSYAVKVPAVGSVRVLDADTGYLTAVCATFIGGLEIIPYASGGAFGFTATFPIIWAAGDQVDLSIAVPVTGLAG